MRLAQVMTQTMAGIDWCGWFRERDQAIGWSGYYHIALRSPRRLHPPISLLDCMGA